MSERAIRGALGSLYTERVRICLFTPTFLPATGGAERDADLLARRLTARGHHVVVLARRLAGKMPELPYPVETYRRPPRQHWWPELLVWPLKRCHRRHRLDVVLAFYSYPTGYAAAKARKKLGVPVVMTPRGADLYENYHELRKVRVQKVIREGYRSADRVVSISRWMTERLETVAGPGSELPPVDLVHNGVDLVEHDQCIADANEQVKAGAMKPLVDGPFALHLARVNAVKGQPTAVEAISRIAGPMRQLGMKYVFVGDGNAMALLRELVRAKGVEDIAILLGTRIGHEKFWLFGHASFFVSTSREEAFGNVVIEAMASGLPMLASDIPVHHELIAERGWGELYRVDEPADMADKLLSWSNGDRDLSEFRKAAMTQRESFTLDEMIQGYESACRAAMEQH